MRACREGCVWATDRVHVRAWPPNRKFEQVCEGADRANDKAVQSDRCERMEGLLLLGWKVEQEKHNDKDETKGDNVKGNHGDCAGQFGIARQNKVGWDHKLGGLDK